MFGGDSIHLFIRLLCPEAMRKLMVFADLPGGVGQGEEAHEASQSSLSRRLLHSLPSESACTVCLHNLTAQSACTYRMMLTDGISEKEIDLAEPVSIRKPALVSARRVSDLCWPISATLSRLSDPVQSPRVETLKTSY